MKRTRARIAMAIATAGVVLAMVGSASAAIPGRCFVVHRTVNGHTVQVTVCV